MLARRLARARNTVTEKRNYRATFLNGSEGFYFWSQALEQGSSWFLRKLQVRLRHDSPRAYERLAPVGGSRSRTAGWKRHEQVLSDELADIGGTPFTQVPTTGCGGVSSSDHGYP